MLWLHDCSPSVRARARASPVLATRLVFRWVSACGTIFAALKFAPMWLFLTVALLENAK